MARQARQPRFVALNTSISPAINARSVKRQSATGESASESPLAELRALIALRSPSVGGDTNLISHSSYLFIWPCPTFVSLRHHQKIIPFRVSFSKSARCRQEERNSGRIWMM